MGPQIYNYWNWCFEIICFITILHIIHIIISIFLQSPDLVTTLFDKGSVLLRLLLSLLHLNYHHHYGWQQCRNFISLACHLSSSSFLPFSLLFLLITVNTKHMIFSSLTEIFSLFAVFCRAITLNKHFSVGIFKY